MPEEEMEPGRWHGASIRAPRRSKSREELKQVIFYNSSSLTPHVNTARITMVCSLACMAKPLHAGLTLAFKPNVRSICSRPSS